MSVFRRFRSLCILSIIPTLVACVGPDHVHFAARPPAITDIYSYPSFYDTVGMVVGKDGVLWIADADAGSRGTRLHRVAANGHMSDIPVPAYGCGLSGIALGPDGSIWYAAPGECTFVHRAAHIGHLLPSGRIRTYSVPQAYGGYAYGIALDEHGQAYLAEDKTNTIVVRTPTGSFYKRAVSGRNPSLLLFEPHRGIVWFTTETTIGKLDKNRVAEYRLPSDCPDPVALATDKRGQPWLVAGGRLLRSRHGKMLLYSPNVICHMIVAGVVQTISIAPSFGAVGGIALGPDGAVWFSAQHAVGRFRQDGGIVAYAVPQKFFPWPYPPITAGGWMAAGTNHNLWLQTTVPGGTGLGEWAALAKFVVTEH